jgi:hypothetical protein
VKTPHPPCTLFPLKSNYPNFGGKWSNGAKRPPHHLLFATALYNEARNPQDYHAFQEKQTSIIQLLMSLVNYAIRNQYVLERWKSIVNTMIFKEAGSYKIHRLRVIHIYEADFNLLLAVKWRRLLHHADHEGLIHAGQYGGRPGCEAQSLTFLEELKYDISFVSRRTIFNFDNDAMSCYDRIILALASLINRKYGQHQTIVAVHAKTLRQHDINSALPRESQTSSTFIARRFRFMGAVKARATPPASGYSSRPHFLIFTTN